MGTRSAIALVSLAWAILPANTVNAQLSPSAQRGLTYVQANCARCHAVDRTSDSPLRTATPFRDLHRRSPVENFPLAMIRGIREGHPNMPAFLLDPGQIDDVIAYLKTLEP